MLREVHTSPACTSRAFAASTFHLLFDVLTGHRRLLCREIVTTQAQTGARHSLELNAIAIAAIPIGMYDFDRSHTSCANNQGHTVNLLENLHGAKSTCRDAGRPRWQSRRPHGPVRPRRRQLRDRRRNEAWISFSRNKDICGALPGSAGEEPTQRPTVLLLDPPILTRWRPSVSKQHSRSAPWSRRRPGRAFRCPASSGKGRRGSLQLPAGRSSSPSSSRKITRSSDCTPTTSAATWPPTRCGLRKFAGRPPAAQGRQGPAPIQALRR